MSIPRCWCPRHMFIPQRSARRACPIFGSVSVGHAHSSRSGLGIGASCPLGRVSVAHVHSAAQCPEGMSNLRVCVRGTCPFFEVRTGHQGIMSTGRGPGRACPGGRTQPSVPPPRLRYTMDMLFDPYADGPFQAASTAAARTKARAGTGFAGLEPGAGFGPDATGADANRPDANRPDANRADATARTAITRTAAAGTGRSFRTPANSSRG